MKIKMNNITIMEIMQVINKFGFVTGKLGYAISKTKSRMLTEIQPFESEREKLITKYGTKDEESGQITIDPASPNFKEFQKEITPLVNDLCEIDIYQVTKEEFDSADIFNEDCSSRDYDLLEAIFVETQKNDKEEPQEE